MAVTRRHLLAASAGIAAAAAVCAGGVGLQWWNQPPAAGFVNLSPDEAEFVRAISGAAFPAGDVITLSGADADLDALLNSIESTVQHLPRLSLSEAATFYIRQGQPVLVPNGPQSGMVRIADAGGLFLGVGDMRDDGKLAPKRLLAQ